MQMSLTKARADMVFDHPFFGAILLRLQMKKVDATPRFTTMGVDGYSIFYTQVFIDAQSHDQLMGVLAHEVMHVAMLHHTRMGNRNHELWNIACDYAINENLLKAGFKLPRPGCIDEKGEFQNMTAEAIYAKLLEDPDIQKQMAEGSGNGDGPKGELSHNGNISNDQIIAPPKGKELCAEQDAKELAQTGLIAGKNAGKMPSHIEEMIIGAQESQVNWADELRQYLTSSSSGRPSWSRPNARLLEQAYLPYRYPEPSGELVLLVDSSGSVNNDMLQSYASELRPIMLDNNITKLTVIYFTYGVDRVDVFTNADDVIFKIEGRGGTCFQTAFEYMYEHCTNYNAVLVFTDGEDSFDGFEQPDVPTIWCITDRQSHRGGSPAQAPWGITINLEF